MLLYDISYKDRTFDRNVPLPPTAPKGTIARCTNGPLEVFKFDGQQWHLVGWVDGSGRYWTTAAYAKEIEEA
jgi:hypothetical protein